jgi:hypothetical protein
MISDLFARALDEQAAVHALQAKTAYAEASAIPAEWRAGIEQLVSMLCPRTVLRHDAWAEMVRATMWLDANGFLRQAHALGWTARDLWGCDPRGPDTRYDLMGLAWCLSGGTVVALRYDGARILNRRHDHTSWYARDNADPTSPIGRERRRAVPAWQLSEAP